MASKIKLKSNSGGSLSLTSDDALIDDEEVIIKKSELEALYAGNVGIGAGQTWQDVASERNAGIDYVNDTGKPIVVSVSGGNTGTLRILCNNITAAYIYENASGIDSFVTAIIPNGSTYQVYISEGSIINWAELR